ncbi:MAG: type II toxin-antitoxin system RelE/ParE family toxin [Thermoanaerobaculia bacterium]|nr:type II toxin-antitoxin system RelE/ParE family toxin [Thermoanaerobaculia bacterium]
MARLRWTAHAETTLAQIYRAMAESRPATARRTLESLLHRLDSLSDAPHLGKQYPYAEGVRTSDYGQFRIAYRPETEGITVLGVFHGLMFLPPS